MSDFGDLLDLVLALQREVAELRTRQERMLTVGPVTHSEHGKGVRVDLGGGAEGKPHLSPYLAHADTSGVTSYRPRVGDQVMILAPNGDLEQGVVHGLDHSDAKKNPAPDGDTTVLHNLDGATISTKSGEVTVKAKKITLDVGGVSYVLGDDIHKFSGGKLEHDGKNVGKTHRHTDVESGAAQSGPPAA